MRDPTILPRLSTPFDVVILVASHGALIPTIIALYRRRCVFPVQTIHACAVMFFSISYHVCYAMDACLFSDTWTNRRLDHYFSLLLIPMLVLVGMPLIPYSARNVIACFYYAAHAASHLRSTRLDFGSNSVLWLSVVLLVAHHAYAIFLLRRRPWGCKEVFRFLIARDRGGFTLSFLVAASGAILAYELDYYLGYAVHAIWHVLGMGATLHFLTVADNVSRYFNLDHQTCVGVCDAVSVPGQPTQTVGTIRSYACMYRLTRWTAWSVGDADADADADDAGDISNVKQCPPPIYGCRTSAQHTVVSNAQPAESFNTFLEHAGIPTHQDTTFVHHPFANMGNIQMVSSVSHEDMMDKSKRGDIDDGDRYIGIAQDGVRSCASSIFLCLGGLLVVGVALFIVLGLILKDGPMHHSVAGFVAGNPAVIFTPPTLTPPPPPGPPAPAPAPARRMLAINGPGSSPGSGPQVNHGIVLAGYFDCLTNGVKFTLKTRYSEKNRATEPPIPTHVITSAYICTVPNCPTNDTSKSIQIIGPVTTAAAPSVSVSNAEIKIFLSTTNAVVDGFSTTWHPNIRPLCNCICSAPKLNHLRTCPNDPTHISDACWGHPPVLLVFFDVGGGVTGHAYLPIVSNRWPELAPTVATNGWGGPLRQHLWV